MFELAQAVEGLIKFLVIALFLFSVIGIIAALGSRIGRRPPPDDRPRDGGGTRGDPPPGGT